jgi:hypothetical protein
MNRRLLLLCALGFALPALGAKPDKADRAEKAAHGAKDDAKEKPTDPLAGRRVAVSSTLVVKVTDRDAAADAAIDTAEKAGGYFITRDNQQVVLKVPVPKAEDVTAKAAGLGVVVQRSFAANDIGQTLDEQRTLLKSRETVFQRYFAVLASATPSTIVEVESEMTRLVAQIESLKGQIKLMEHQLRYATITVQFEFRDRRPPVRTGNSSFAWLNTVNLSDLMGAF